MAILILFSSSSVLKMTRVERQPRAWSSVMVTTLQRSLTSLYQRNFRERLVSRRCLCSDWPTHGTWKNGTGRGATSKLCWEYQIMESSEMWESFVLWTTYTCSDIVKILLVRVVKFYGVLLISYSTLPCIDELKLPRLPAHLSQRVLLFYCLAFWLFDLRDDGVEQKLALTNCVHILSTNK